MTTSDDSEVAWYFAELIKRFDAAVFPNNPIGKIMIIRSGFDSDWFGNTRHLFYIPGDSVQQEHYRVIVSGISEAVKAECRQKRHIIDDNVRRLEDIAEAPLFSTTELRIAMAGHEVRHRVQESVQTELFTPENTDLIPSLRLLALFLARGASSVREFDAKVIEYILGREARLKELSVDRVASLIKSLPRDFRAC